MSLFFEIAARFLLCLFLVWCVFYNRADLPFQGKAASVLALLACGFAVFAQRHAVAPEAALICTVLVAAGLAVGWLIKGSLPKVSRQEGILPGAKTPKTGVIPQEAAAWAAVAPTPVAASAIGFFSGSGAVVTSAATALSLMFLEPLIQPKSSRSPKESSCSRLRIRAQSITGLVGRIEGLLERLTLSPVSVSVDHHPGEKELSITIELAQGECCGATKTKLMRSLQETEGVIRFALD